MLEVSYGTAMNLGKHVGEKNIRKKCPGQYCPE